VGDAVGFSGCAAGNEDHDGISLSRHSLGSAKRNLTTPRLPRPGVKIQ
jgi:hypothetical protein